MNETVIVITAKALGTMPTNLEKRQKELKMQGKIESPQITALLKLARILRRVLES